MFAKEIVISELLLPAVEIAREAGRIIMGHYRSGDTVDRKEDASPVTEADRAADRYIVEKLKVLAPSILSVSEEGAKPAVANADYFWLIDPLDGTKSFIRGKGYFTVNIGLIRGVDKTPVMGVIYDPVNDKMYYGSGKGAFRNTQGHIEQIYGRKNEGAPVAIVSHSHLDEATEEYLRTHNISERIPCASSIKFCWLAEGKGSVYPRFGPTMEWDTAAGHAILAAAGGTMLTPEGKPFLYGKPNFLNGNFVASV